MKWRKIRAGLYRAVWEEDSSVILYIENEHKSRWVLYMIEPGRSYQHPLGERINRGFSKQQLIEGLARTIDRARRVRQENELQEAKRVQEENELHEHLEMFLSESVDPCQDMVPSPTSFRIDDRTKRMLAEIAKKYGISQNRTLSRLIREAHARLFPKRE